MPVSVVIPCYEAGETVRRAVESVARQTAIPAEVIVVDDASGPQTRGVLEELRVAYGEGWITIVSLAKNGGPAAARNVGWDRARQPYIAFLDADDAWHPRKLEVQYGWMCGHPEVAMTANDYIHVRTVSDSHDALPTEWKPRAVGRRQLLLSNRFSTPCVMLRRELPFRFPAAKRHSEDYHLWLEIVLSGNVAEKLPIPLTYLYKAPFGDGGLSGNLWKAEKGQLDTYRRVYRAGLISAWDLLWLIPYSLLKHVRRWMIVRSRGSEAIRAY